MMTVSKYLHTANISSRYVWVYAVLAIILCLFTLTSLANFNQNDFMYAVAPLFLKDATLYKDLPFLQAPFSIYTFEFISKFVNEGALYLSLRLFSLSLIVASGIFLTIAANKIGGKISGCIFFFLFFSSYHVAYTSMEIGNYSLSLFFICVSAYLYLCHRLTWQTSALIGLLIGLAASAKLNHALFAIPFGAFIATDSGIRSRQALAYVVGGVAGSTLLIFHAASNFEDFYFFNVQIHHLINEFRHEKLPNEFDSVTIASIKIFLWFLPQIFLIAYSIKNDVFDSKCRRHYKILVLAAFSYFVAILPNIIFAQYLAPLVSFLCLATALAIGTNVSKVVWRSKFVVVLSIVVATSWALPYLAVFAIGSLESVSKQGIAPSRIARMSEQISDITSESFLNGRCDHTALTFSPVPFLGTSFQLPKFSATGPFLPQLSGFLEVRVPERNNLTDLQSELQKNPTAILVGFYSNMKAERELAAYAVAHGYLRHELGSIDQRSTLVLFLRPTCSNQQ